MFHFNVRVSTQTFYRSGSAILGIESGYYQPDLLPGQPQIDHGRREDLRNKDLETGHLLNK